MMSSTVTAGWMRLISRKTSFCNNGGRCRRHPAVASGGAGIRDRRGIVSVNNNDANSKKTMAQLRLDYKKEIAALPETHASERLGQFLQAKVTGRTTHTQMIRPPIPPVDGYRYEMTPDQVLLSIDAMLATFCLHVEARIAALVGQGYYTIGPCGEETLAPVGPLLTQPMDSVALHYRHLAINISRQLSIHAMKMKEGTNGNHSNGSPNSSGGTPTQSSSFSSASFLEQLLLDRARGYTVSRHDPVTGGVHCSIGSAVGSDDDFKTYGRDYIVTSTLSSQCTPAVGRALGYSLINHTAIDNDDNNNIRPVSFVTVGDGSIHNHHFWSAYHLARHARHRQRKCPVVFGVSDNGVSISYKTGGYVNTLFGPGPNGAVDPLVPVFRVENANDMADVYDQTRQALEYARSRSRPCVVLYSNLVRRFGHAASDRQQQYLTDEEIMAMRDVDTLERSIVQAVEVYGHILFTYADIFHRYQQIQEWTQNAFDIAAMEDKVARRDMLDRVAPPLVSLPSTVSTISDSNSHNNNNGSSSESVDGDTEKADAVTSNKPEVMRKHMTRVYEEILRDNSDVVYMGEDVQHGGYYLVTEGLAAKFPGRVIDFPPDETSLLGAALGFSQVGLTCIVEIPYSKYLDCAADIFNEIAVMNWLSNNDNNQQQEGSSKTGMLIRLQGFDRGVFGGNFHTNNRLEHIPPGIDVVCYSNGTDYVKGVRYALHQAKYAGRVVMSVDSTHLLNLRHLHEKDRAWERPYPAVDSLLGFNKIHRYGTSGTCAVITYGNGVVTALQARKATAQDPTTTSTSGISEADIDIIDCPYLSGIPEQLVQLLEQGQYDSILFADVCKDGPSSNVLSSFACTLQQDKLLPNNWDFVAAPRTYNPLGNTCTFLNADDIHQALKKLLAQRQT